MLPLVFALLLSLQLVAAGDAAPFARLPHVATLPALSQVSAPNPKFALRDSGDNCPPKTCELGWFTFHVPTDTGTCLDPCKYFSGTCVDDGYHCVRSFVTR